MFNQQNPSLMISPTIVDHICYCASNLAYEVDSNGNFPPIDTPLYFTGNPYLNYVVKSGLLVKDGKLKITPFANKGDKFDKINAAILLEFTGFNVLAFRGTLHPACNIPAIKDWMQDFMLKPEHADGFPGDVHSGFFDGYKTISSKIFEYLKPFKNVNLWITGHSKGGPMASYATYQALELGYDVLNCVTFASPHPGNVEFSKGYEKLLRSKFLEQYNYANDLDIVPLVPPEEKTSEELCFLLSYLSHHAEKKGHKDIAELFKDMAKEFSDSAKGNYFPVGKLKYITKDHQIVSDFPGLWDVRKQQFINNFLHHLPWKALGKIGAAHAIKIGGGYQQGVFPDIAQHKG